MKAALLRLIKILGLVGSAFSDYRRATGLSILVWLVIAFLNLALQILFRRELAPGEFALLNSTLGAIALAAMPIIGLRQVLAFYHQAEFDSGRRETFQNARLPLVQNFSLAWAFVCAVFFLPALNFLHLPRIWIGFLALANVFILLGAGVGAAFYEQQNKMRLWAFLLCLAGLARLLVAWPLASAEPWAEAGLAAGLAAGLLLLTPILRQARIVFAWRKMAAALRDREFRLYLAATLSVTIGVFLFTSADRIVAQAWFGQSTDNNLGLVRWSLFDGYQTAGLLGRSLLWGTQPLLFLLLARRAPEVRTARGIYVLLWIYLAALVAGAVLLCLLAQPLARLFGGEDPGTTAYFIPGFASAMIPLGLLQGIGFFALASRRYPECFTLGVCGLAYTLFLMLEGKPQLMLTCMFGGGGGALMIVLFLAVVRWGRAQP